MWSDLQGAGLQDVLEIKICQDEDGSTVPMVLFLLLNKLTAGHNMLLEGPSLLSCVCRLGFTLCV